MHVMKPYLLFRILLWTNLHVKKPDLIRSGADLQIRAFPSSVCLQCGEVIIEPVYFSDNNISIACSHGFHICIVL